MEQLYNTLTAGVGTLATIVMIAYKNLNEYLGIGIAAVTLIYLFCQIRNKLIDYKIKKFELNYQKRRKNESKK